MTLTSTTDDVFDRLRRKLAGEIRSRVIGGEADDKAAAMITAPGDRWFAEDAVIRQVHGDAALFVGGLRAILLQSLHPLAMAGVAQHSDYRSDPWGRLQRTASFLASTTFGPAPVAERVVATVRRVHERVVGVASDGRPYSANDPHLLGWVHIAETDSFLSAHQRFGRRRLSGDEADAYVNDAAVIATQLGVIDPPRNVAELQAALRQFRPELRGTPEARAAARFLLFDPPLPMAARAPYAVLAATAVALLPTWARWPLRLPFFPLSEQLLVRPAGVALTNAIRWSLSG